MKWIFTFIIVTFVQISCTGQNEKLGRIQQFSEEIVFIDMAQFVYNRMAQYNYRRFMYPINKFLNFSDSLSIEEIEKCLNDKSAKVRALGLLCLYQTDDQKSFLRIANFLADSSPCFKQISYYRFSKRIRITGVTFKEKELLEQAEELHVSDIAKYLLNHYLKCSGYNNFINDLESFIKEREHLEYTSGFLKLLKLKATGGIMPFQKERQPLLDEVKNRINRITNNVDRAIYKIYLSTYEHELFSQELLVIELKLLGRERVKRLLTRQPPTNDPDLLNIQNRGASDFEYNRMCKWILLNAKKIFSIEDIPFFLQRAKYERENTRSWKTTLHFPYWYIAAARVDQANSSNYIKSGLAFFDERYYEFERGKLFAELWHQRGLEEIDFILDWTFNSYSLNEKGRERIDVFIHYLDQKEDLILLTKIIMDNRFENSMNVWNVIQVAWQVNRLRDDNPIKDDLTRKIRHPLGLDRVEWWRDRALDEYPNETKEMFEKMEILIEELRKLK